jgi:hypothetical protein
MNYLQTSTSSCSYFVLKLSKLSKYTYKGPWLQASVATMMRIVLFWGITQHWVLCYTPEERSSHTKVLLTSLCSFTKPSVKSITPSPPLFHEENGMKNISCHYNGNVYLCLCALPLQFGVIQLETWVSTQPHNAFWILKHSLFLCF